MRDRYGVITMSLVCTAMRSALPRLASCSRCKANWSTDRSRTWSKHQACHAYHYAGTLRHVWFANLTASADPCLNWDSGTSTAPLVCLSLDYQWAEKLAALIVAGIRLVVSQ